MKDNELMADQIRKYMSYIYLVLFVGITIRYYLFTTVLEFNYPNVLYLGLRYVLMAYVLISIVLMVWQKQYSTVLEPVFMVLILVSAGIVTYVVKDNAVFDFALLLVGAKNVPWKRIRESDIHWESTTRQIWRRICFLLCWCMRQCGKRSSPILRLL